MANKVTLTFAGDSKSLEGTFRNVGSQADQTRSRFDKLKTGAKVLSAAVLGGLAVAFKVGFGEMLDSQKVAAQTDAALKSTGNAAKVTAGHVADLAGELMKKSGVDDEVIQSGSNVLLTFTKIRNEVGAGNAIFDRATQSALDMSVALGTDMKGASILVGKALNDPVKGLTALGKSGIQFTAAQKESIKAMVDSGNTMGAQKAILKELEVQFGGSADAAGKTLSGQLNVAKQTFNNLAGSIVGAVIPAVLGITGVLIPLLGWFQQHETITTALVGVLAGLAATVWVVNAAVKAYTAVQLVLNAVLSANPIGLVIIAIAALAAGLIVAYQNSSTFRSIVKAAFDAVKVAADAVATAIGFIVTAIKAAWDSPVVGAIRLYYVTQFNLVKGAIQAVVDVIEMIVGAVKAANDSKALGAIKQAFGDTFSPIKDVINTVVDALKNVVSWFGTAISKVSSFIGKIKDIPGGGILDRFMADGGIVTTPTTAMIGEAGPEVVIPLTRPRRAQELLEASGLAGSGGGGGGPLVNVQHMTVRNSTDVYQVASQLGRQLAMAGA